MDNGTTHFSSITVMTFGISLININQTTYLVNSRWGRGGGVGGDVEMFHTTVMVALIWFLGI